MTTNKAKTQKPCANGITILPDLGYFFSENGNNRAIYCNMRIIDEKPKMFKITKYPPRMV